MITEEQYNEYLERIDKLMVGEDITDDQLKELDSLATQVEEYEKVHYPILNCPVLIREKGY